MTKLGWAKPAGMAALAISFGMWVTNCAKAPSALDAEDRAGEQAYRSAPSNPAEPRPPAQPAAGAVPPTVSASEVPVTGRAPTLDVGSTSTGASVSPPAPAKKDKSKLAEKPAPTKKPVAQPRELPREAPSDDADEEGGIEGGVEGGVVGGVVGGVIGGVLGGRIAEQPSGPSLPYGAPSSPPPPPARYEVKREARPEPSERVIPPGTDGNRFEKHKPNPFTLVEKDRFSTFAVDVDTASYALARRYINEGQLPPADAVRVEEFVNYFKYKYPQPEKGAFTVDMEGAPSPYTPGHHLLKVGVQGKILSKSQRKTAHLVFLVDVSGSMAPEDRLPLARESMRLAVKGLGENDTVSIVTYAGAVRDVLPPTPATDHAKIHAAIDSLQPGGGTAMGSGIELAYKHAVQKASANAISRVIVLTDGDTNIGRNLNADSMLESVRKYVQEGVTLSTIGFGMGNYRDDLMERLADKGNGNCFYIDSHKEAKKVFEQQLTGTLEVIAKDVKLQVEFDPTTVRAYRLLGYENRDIADKDFRNDKVDAGEIGAGHSVTALYEVLLTGKPGDLATVRVRAKEPSGTEAKEQAFSFNREKLKPTLAAASDDFRFAAAVAGTADMLRRSDASEAWSLATAEKLAQGATGGQSERQDFVRLLIKARTLWEAAHRAASR